MAIHGPIEMAEEPSAVFNARADYCHHAAIDKYVYSLHINDELRICMYDDNRGGDGVEPYTGAIVIHQLLLEAYEAGRNGKLFSSNFQVLPPVREDDN